MTETTLSPPPTAEDCPSWASDWALFLDIDGTLLDFADRPQAVIVPDSLPGLLACLAKGLDGALAVVSGRPLSDIDNFFPIGADAAGTHGAQWRLAGVEHGPGKAVEEALGDTGDRLHAFAEELPGVLLERKPHAVALHYRLAPEHEQRVHQIAEETAESLGSLFRLQKGKRVVELLPAAASKGAAIERFMEHAPYRGRTPLFIGDDRTDEAGFGVVNALGGLSVRVGDGWPTEATYRMESPTAVRAWLAALAATLPAG